MFKVPNFLLKTLGGNDWLLLRINRKCITQSCFVKENIDAARVHQKKKRSNVRANKRSSLKRPAHVSRITYRLVAKQDVDIRHDLHQGLFKELADERRWEVHAEDLVAIRGMLRHLHDRLGGHGQEKPLGTRTGFIYIVCVCEEAGRPRLEQTRQYARFHLTDSVVIFLTGQHQPKYTWVQVSLHLNPLNG